MAGRPLKFKTVEDLESACNAYFESCWETRESDKPAEIKNGEYKEAKKSTYRFMVRPYTITGLALALDTSRDVLIDYETLESRREYSNTIKRAKLRCQNFAEEQLFSGKQAAGAIFNLVNNYKWENKHRQEVTGTGGGPIASKIEIVFINPKDSGRVPDKA